MIIRTAFMDRYNRYNIGIADFICKDLSDFEFAITSDPRIRVFACFPINVGKVKQGDIPLIDADRYREVCEYKSHEPLDLLSFCEEV